MCSNISNSDAKQVLKGIRISDVNKLIFGQLNINQLRNKFDMLMYLTYLRQKLMIVNILQA